MHYLENRRPQLTVIDPNAVAGPDRTDQPGLVSALLRFPLFYKILVANVAIMAVLVLAVVLVTRVDLSSDGPRLLGLFLLGLLTSVGTNALILRLALSPLRRLQETADRVNAGDTTARVAPSSLADRELERLTATFNAMLESSETYRRRLRETAQRAITAQEEERKRIGRELHDGIAQTMAALRVRIRVARALEDASAQNQLLERIGSELGEATEEVRRIAQGLRPPALDMLGLAPAIESCVRSIGDTAGLALETQVQGVDGLLTPEAELVVYRIVQEALSNVARHSRAGTVRVELAYGNGAVTAVVQDDGLGFDVTAEMSRGGLGLFGMQERAAYVGGTVRIESEPGGGTQIHVVIPVAERARYA
jgi:two-component system, NarL family, sensor histidine kinase UhpB